MPHILNETPSSSIMSDDEYEIPLQDQRVFGAGIKRKRVHFVPSSDSPSATKSSQQAAGTTSVGDRYLRLVLSKSVDMNPTTTQPSSISSAGKPLDVSSSPALCDICSLPLPSSPCTTQSAPPHEATLAHQVCLEHSHPPSSLDRSRLGLRYLQSQGWDPDSRQGLGANGQGIQFPIKAKVKDDKLGVGLVFLGKNGTGVIVKEKTEKLDAGKVRKLQVKDCKRRERLQELFYRNEDLDRYLGTG